MSCCLRLKWFCCLITLCMQIFPNIHFDRINLTNIQHDDHYFYAEYSPFCRTWDKMPNLLLKIHKYHTVAAAAVPSNRYEALLMHIVRISALQPLHIYRKRGYSYLAEIFLLLMPDSAQWIANWTEKPAYIRCLQWLHSFYSFFWLSLFILSAEWSDNKFWCTTASDSIEMGCSKFTFFNMARRNGKWNEPM